MYFELIVSWILIKNLCACGHNGCSVCCCLKIQTIKRMIKRDEKGSMKSSRLELHIKRRSSAAWHGPAGRWSTHCSSNYWHWFKCVWWEAFDLLLDTKRHWPEYKKGRQGTHVWWQVLLEAVVFGLEVKLWASSAYLMGDNCGYEHWRT